MRNMEMAPHGAIFFAFEKCFLVSPTPAQSPD